MEENEENTEKRYVSRAEADFFYERAGKYKFRATFRIVEKDLYNSIRRRDPSLITNINYTDLCDCRTKIDRDVLWELVTHYKSAKELREASYTAYMNALKYNLFEDEAFTAHFVKTSKYSYDEVCAEAKKYTHRTEFAECSKAHYAKAQYEGWLDIACAHMPKRKSSSKYTNQYLLEEASKYKNQAELRKENYAIFMALVKRKITKLVDYKKEAP